MRMLLKKIAVVRVIYAIVRTLKDQFGCNFGAFTGLWRMGAFFQEFRSYKRQAKASSFTVRARDVYPCLTDRTATTPIEPTYFLQDTWFAGRIAAVRPETHVDVASSVKSLALVAQFVPVTFIDIRPVDLPVPNFSFLKGSVLSLPFGDASVASLSSLCVIEHIGLGRYGDPIDPEGSEKAAKELGRVLAPMGNLYISVPVDDVCRTYFNAHRAFTRDYILSLFQHYNLVEERYIYGRELCECYDRSRGFGTGLYHLRKS